MKIALLLLALTVGIVAKAPLLKLSDPSTHIPGSYIIVLHANITEEIRDKHITQLSAKFQPGHRISHRYHIGDFIGFAAEISDDLVDYELNHPDVEYIEHDGVVTIDQTCTRQNGAIWNLDRVSERQITALDGHFDYPSSAGTGVFAYIIDTGIYLQHNDFGGRATFGTNTVDTNNADCNGHGTHVASTTGGTVWGVAKNVRLIAVKVLNCAGSGSNAGVIAGVDWTARDYQARGTSARAVANMSLGGARSTASNQAVENAIAAGVQFAIAAGNSNTDACNSSPASAPSGLTVASTALVGGSGGQQIDQRSSFSNYGTCVHIYAPGSTITAAWIGSANAQNTISGTSMASPHVCGVLALLAGQAASRLTPAALKTQIINLATTGIVQQNCANSVCNSTPNRFVYDGC
jgi:subtilisin family serine protease